MSATLAIVLLGVLLPCPAYATPVTLKFETPNWTLNDLTYVWDGCVPHPSECALTNGLAALGIILNNPSGTYGSFPPISWTFTIDDDSQGGVSVTGQITLGPNTYVISSGHGWIGGGFLNLDGLLTGPPLASSYGFTPRIVDFQFSYASAAFTSNQVSSTNWMDPALFVAGRPMMNNALRSDPHNHFIWLDPRLVSVSVPEPSSLSVLSGAVLAFGLWRASRRREPNTGS